MRCYVCSTSINWCGAMAGGADKSYHSTVRGDCQRCSRSHEVEDCSVQKKVDLSQRTEEKIV